MSNETIRILLLSVVLHVSCSLYDIKYASLDVNDEQIDFNVLNDSFIFRNPIDILIHKDYLIVNDPMHPTHAIHLFNKHDGQHITSLVRRGRGPNEVTLVNSLAVNPDGKLIAFDPNLNKVITVDLNSTTHSISEYTIINVPCRVAQVVPLGEDMILLKGTTADMRFAIYNCLTKEVQYNYTAYPQLDSDSETNCSIWDYAVQVSYDTQSGMLAVGTYVGCVLEILQLIDGEIQQTDIAYMTPPIFSYASGVRPKYISTNKETIVGFQDLQVKDKLVYGLVWDVPKGQLKDNRSKIVTFTNTTEVVTSYSGKDYIFAFAVDVDCIYTIMMTDDGQYYMAKTQ